MQPELLTALTEALRNLTPKNYQALLFMLALPTTTTSEELVAQLGNDPKLFESFKSFISILGLEELIKIADQLPPPLAGEAPDLDDLLEDEEADEYTKEIPKMEEQAAPPITRGEAAEPPPPPTPQPATPPGGSPPVKPIEDQFPRQRGEPYLTTADLAQPPQFTAFYPQQIETGQAYALMVFAYLERFYETAVQIANGYTGMMGDKQAHATTKSAVAVDIGSLITVVPQIEGIRFNPAEALITWQPPLQHTTFLFTTPAQLPPMLKGRVLIFQGALLIGEIPITLLASTAKSTGQHAASFKRYDPIFASYSHKDTPVMEYFRQSRLSLGQKMLVDIYDLRSGEHWANRLLQMIDESAVFQLFWSDHSAQSKYCRQEWEYALQLNATRERFIQPVWWSAPMPAPPPELADLHFQKITLPAVTRFQVAASRVRSFFGRR